MTGRRQEIEREVHRPGRNAPAVPVTVPGTLPQQPITLQPAAVIELQRLIGNRATVDLLPQSSPPIVIRRRVDPGNLAVLAGVAPKDIKSVLDGVTLLIATYNEREEDVEGEEVSQEWIEGHVAAVQNIQEVLETLPTRWARSAVDEERDFAATHALSLATLLGTVRAERVRVGQQLVTVGLGSIAQVPVGQNIHFIWSGRAISSTALANIAKWGEVATAKKWNVTIWTDAVTQDWGFIVKAMLRYKGIQLRNITKSDIDPRFWTYYTGVVHGETKNFPAASDIARYSILQRHGGIYVDVDIAPGTIDLDSIQEVRLPLMAPQLRDAESVRETLKLDGGTPITPDHVRQAAARRISQGIYNNNFIVSPPNSRALEAAIEEVLAMLELTGGAKNLVDVPGDAAFVTGPATLVKGLFNYFKTMFSQLDQGEVMAALKEGMRHNLGVEWITPESETQEH